MSELRIPVPGSFCGSDAFLDLETVKVPTDGFVMKNGEALRNRWSVALAGVALGGEVVIFGGPELFLLSDLGEELALADEVVYSATREFDEMICRGRFTNARRAHEPVPFFPAVPGAESFRWHCYPPVRAAVEPAPRGEDVASRDVPAALARGDRAVVLTHLLRDVAELIWFFGEPDSECRSWLYRVLTDYDFAAALVS